MEVIGEVTQRTNIIMAVISGLTLIYTIPPKTLTDWLILTGTGTIFAWCAWSLVKGLLEHRAKK